MKKVRLGIDFGTTHTVVAVSDRGNFPVVSFVGPDQELAGAYPSVVAEEGGKLFFGMDALEKPNRLRSFKRLLSASALDQRRSVRVGQVEVELGDLLSGFLAALRRDLISRSNVPVPITQKTRLEAIVAVPASAHSTQRFLTLDAFQRAGFDVLAMMNEPSAAGVEYAHRYRKSIRSTKQNVLVYDMGGGTFDASLVRMFEGAHEVLDSRGSMDLGGDDFDGALLSLVLERAGIKTLTAVSSLQLREHAKEQKERIRPTSRTLSFELGACLDPEDLDRYGISEDAEQKLKIPDLYERCRPLVDRSLELLSLLGDVENREEGLAGVYVVGGGSALPLVPRVLRERFSKKVHVSSYPFASTAIGLAIAGDQAQGYSVKDRFARSFGVFRELEDGAAVSFDPLLARDLQLPSKGEHVTASRCYRAQHNIGHFRFVECGWVDESGRPQGDIAPVRDVYFPFDSQLREGAAAIDRLPVERQPGQGALIEETYRVDSNGIIELRIVDLDTGFEARHELR